MPAVTWAGERLAPLWTLVGTLALAAAAWGAPGGVVLSALGVVCLALACRVPGEGLRLVGPVAVYELVRATRKRRVILWRAIVGGGLFLAAAYSYEDLRWTPARTIGTVAAFGEAIAHWILGVLWAVVTLSVLLIAPTVVAEDRERRQLDFALVTDLRGREVVFGRLLAALAEAGGLALVAVPLLALVPLFGGVDPAALACSLALLCSTALTVAGLAALASASARTAAGATWRLCLGLAGYGILSGWAAAYLPWVGATPLRLVVAANPFALAGAAVFPGTDALAAWRQARPTLAVHLALFLGCGSLAVARLRAVAAGPKSPRVRRRRGQPALGDVPALEWRERFDIRRACPAWRTLLAVAAVLGTLYLTVWARWSDGNVFTRFTGAGTLALYLLLLGRAVARRLDDDHRSGMWDLLRLTPLTGAEEVAQKRRAAWHGGGMRMFVALAIFWLIAEMWDWIAWGTVPVLLIMTAVALDATVALAIRLGVGSSGRAARTFTLLWLAFVVAPVPLGVLTFGMSLCLDPVAGALMWAAQEHEFRRQDEQSRLLLQAPVVLALVVPFAAWWLRRTAAGRVRPVVVRPSE